MKRLLIYSFLIYSWIANTQAMDHSKWTEVLQSYVTDNGAVNYRGLQNNRAVLNAYLNDLS